MMELTPTLSALVRAGRLSTEQAGEVAAAALAAKHPVEEELLARGLLPRESMSAALVALARLPTVDELLCLPGGLTRTDLERARDAAAHEKVSLTEYLLRSRAVKPEDLARALATRHGLQYLDLATHASQTALVRRYDIGLLQRLNALPLNEHEGRLKVAVDDPGDLERREQIRAAFGDAVDLVVSPAGQIQRVIVNVIEGTIAPASAQSVARAEGDAGETAAPELAAGEVIGLLDQILSRAIRKGASDIHIEPYGSVVKVKIRVDGVLAEMAQLETRLSGPLIGRIKVLARLDVSEKRLPQDGRMQASVDGRAIDLRVSTLPTVNGESAVLRILDKTKLGLELEKLGIPEKEMTVFRRAIARPYGMVIVAGPTGSGKTTTLYSAVRSVQAPGLKLMTIEDPVEYQMLDVVQIAVNEKQGLTFAAGLRSIVRQDPNKILVGEIRDAETARIAVNAALTGHLVLTTIHANDTIEALVRLSGIGIHPRDFVSSLNLISSQRLLRRICASCREPHDPVPAALREVTPDFERYPGVVPHIGRGCAVCQRSGSVGRTGIYEALPIDSEMRELVLAETTPTRLRAHVSGRGWKCLREAAWELVKAGDVSLEELNRVTVAD